MAITMVITNLTASSIQLNDFYATLGPAGASNASLTLIRSMSHIDSMHDLKALVTAGTVSLVMTQTGDNVDIMSIPVEQHGTSATASVAAVATVVVTVTFPKPFSAAPKVTGTLNRGAAETWKGSLYLQSVSASAAVFQVDVTTLQAATTTTINWQAVL